MLIITCKQIKKYLFKENNISNIKLYTKHEIFIVPKHELNEFHDIYIYCSRLQNIYEKINEMKINITSLKLTISEEIELQLKFNIKTGNTKFAYPYPS